MRSNKAMKRQIKYVFSLLFIMVSLFALNACGANQATTPPPASSSDGREIPTPPPEYAGKKNPLTGNAGAIEAGKGIYNSNCASCHGETGLGDGPAAKSLNPPPRPLAHESYLTDAYMYWRIAEGGGIEPFRSAMPAWKSFLNEEKIWQVIAYLRSLMG